MSYHTHHPWREEAEAEVRQCLLAGGDREAVVSGALLSSAHRYREVPFPKLAMESCLARSRLGVSLASFPPFLPHTLRFKVHLTCHNYFTGLFRSFFFSGPICLLFFQKDTGCGRIGTETGGETGNVVVGGWAETLTQPQRKF